MKTRILGPFLAAALLAGASVAAAKTGPSPAPGSDAAVAQQVAHQIRMYPHYTIWDNINFRVWNGNVDLNGAVTEPYKKSDLTKIIRRTPGVASVTNELEVLPLSDQDTRLRFQVARAIYSDPTLSKYGIEALPPIHIIVDNGHVTLEGVVNNNLEKQLAGMRAGTAGLSFGPIVNHLQVESPGKKG